MTPGYRRLVFGAALLTLGVVVMGAYVRLSDAGLSCPDWPGCYGQLVVPSSDSDVNRAHNIYPDRPLVIHRAWKEMIHRYLAGVLGIAIVLIAALACRRRRDPLQPLLLPLALVGLVLFQAALGMWTVTSLLKPLIVTAHLLGGMATLALLWWLWLTPDVRTPPGPTNTRTWAAVSVAMVAIQLALGGWTSANYAALACPQFPTCQGSWWPDMSFSDAFHLWRELGHTSEGAPLDAQALVTIQVIHRAGALMTLTIVGGFALVSFGLREGRSKYAAATVMILLLTQLGLGVATILTARPLSIAVAHNAIAALLLLAVVTLARFRTNPVP